MTSDQEMRDLLTAVASATSEPAGLADRLIDATQSEVLTRPSTRRQWIAPLLAAAAVVALVVGGVAVARHHHTPPSHKPTPSPTKPTPTPAFPGFTATAVYFLSPTNGWALGDGRCPTGAKTDCAMLLGTTNGGHTWSKLRVPPHVVSTQDHASCGDNGGIAGPCIDNLVFATPKIGYLWSYHRLYMTTDGGVQWKDLRTSQVTTVTIVGSTALKLYAIYPCSSPCVYRLQAAEIGTDNWATVTPTSTVPGNGTTLFGDADTAYLLSGYLAGPNFTPAVQKLYYSSDGRHWTLDPEPVCGTTKANVISIVDVTTGPGGALTETCTPADQTTGAPNRVSVYTGPLSAGKITTAPQDVPPTVDSVQVSVVSPNVDQMRLVLSDSGNDGATWLSDDFGGTWKVVDHVGLNPTGRFAFPFAQFTTATAGYRVAPDGTFVSITNDGGATWTHLVF